MGHGGQVGGPYMPAATALPMEPWGYAAAPYQMMGGEEEYGDEEDLGPDEYYDEYGYEVQGFEGDGLSMYQDGIQ